MRKNLIKHFARIIVTIVGLLVIAVIANWSLARFQIRRLPHPPS